MPETPLLELTALAGHHRALRALGYRTAEQFVAAAHANKPALAKYLQVDVDELLLRVPAAVRQQMAAFGAEPLRPLALGVALERIPRPVAAFSISLPPLAPPTITKVNLIPQMPPVRDQASRFTCVAFASLAAVEHYAGLQNAYQEMSEQFLYWECKQNDGHPSDRGTWLAVAFQLLERDGCCLQSTWPYNPSPIPGNEGQGPPPTQAPVEALNYRVTTFHQLAPTSVQDIRHELLRQRCVAFSIPVFDSWLNSTEVRRTGEITLPIPNETPSGGHAMCIVGFDDLPDQVDLGGGRFLVRNSWNSYWGTASPYGVGYGSIPYAYVARFGVEAYSIY